MGLPRRWRLGETARIRQILARGRRSGGEIGSLHVLPGTGTDTRACLVFSRRVGNAVVRNRGRRRVQAALLSLEPRLEGAWDLVFRGRARCCEVEFQLLRAGLEQLLAEAKVPLSSGAPARE